MSTAPASPQAETKPAANGQTRRRMLAIVGAMVVIGIIGGGAYWYEQSKYVFSDKSEVSAPLIQLAPQAAGILKQMSVRDGDLVYASETVGRVGDEMIQSRVSGLVLTAKQDIGAAYAANQSVVTMIEPKELRIIARIDEDKGLKDVYVGQKAVFTVDAFGSKQFEGVVESVGASKRAGDVVFNISDKREVQEFEVKIKYDVDAYPLLQNGMSARVWIIK